MSFSGLSTVSGSCQRFSSPLLLIVVSNKIISKDPFDSFPSGLSVWKIFVWQTIWIYFSLLIRYSACIAWITSVSTQNAVFSTESKHLSISDKFFFQPFLRSEERCHLAGIQSFWEDGADLGQWGNRAVDLGWLMGKTVHDPLKDCFSHYKPFEIWKAGWIPFQLETLPSLHFFF